MRKINKIAGLLTAVFLLCLAGCESKPDNSRRPGGLGASGIPLVAPSPINVYGFDGALLIQFTAVPEAVEYDLRFGTSSVFADASELGKNVLKRSINDMGTQRGPVSGWIEGLENDVEYYIWVNAEFGSLGSSKEYTMATGMPMSSPAIPAGAEVIAGEGLIEVAWYGNDTLAKYALTYEVAYYNIDDAADECRADAIKKTTQFGYVINGLCNGVNYGVKVRAINNNGKSDYTAEMSAIPELATIAPDSPGEIILEQRAKRLKATWDAVRGAAYYELYYSEASSFSVLSEGACESSQQCLTVEQDFGTVSAEITGLDNREQYKVWVKAKNNAGSKDSPVIMGVPDIRAGIDLTSSSFVLAVPTAEYIFGEEMPPESPLSRTGANDYQDSLHRAKETSIGNLFTDSALWYLNVFRDSGEKVDFVFMNSGYIDSGLRPQDPAITVVNLRTVVGNSQDKIVILEMKGSDVKALFEYAVSHSPHLGFRGNHGEGPGGQLFRSSGAWPIVSKGLSYTIQYPFVTREFMKNNAKLGSSNPLVPPFFFGNIEPGTLKLNGVAIDDNKTYRVATTDFNEEGRYIEPMRKATIKKENTGILYWHAVAEYLYDAEYVTPAIDGRIRIKGGVIGGPFGVYEGYNQYCPADATYDEVKGCIFH